MKTFFLLMAQYEGRAVIPVETVCKDHFFLHLTIDKFLRKVGAGEIALPIVRAEQSQKASRGVHVEDLATYLESRRRAAQREIAAPSRW